MSNADDGAYVNGQDFHMHKEASHGDVLSRVRTAGSVSIPPELFEKLYLSPENRVKGDLRKTFGNPTPIGLAGFLLSLSPLCCELMNWGAGTQTGRGAAHIPEYIFFGGVLMITAGVLEWILGNTFIAVVFTTFGSFWLSFGGTLQPFYSAWASYATDPTVPTSGLTTAGFNNSFAYFPLWMGVLCTIYLICSLRTNLIFVLILLPLPGAFGCIAAAFWYTAEKEMLLASTLLTAGGALTFVTTMFGWYLFTALMLAGIDFPIQLPVFDLSTKVKGYNEKRQARTGPEEGEAGNATGRAE